MVRIVRSVTTLGTIAFAALILVMPAATAAAEQDGAPNELHEIRGVGGTNDERPLRDVAPVDATGPRGRPFLAVLMAIPLATYAGATGLRNSEILTPADRFATAQLIGMGYVVNPRFRFGVMGIFNEVFTGLPPAAEAWQSGGIAPIGIGTFDHVIIGGGPIIAYRSGGKYQSDVGAVVLSGASIPLRKGLALNIAAPVTALFVRRHTVSVAIAVGVAKVF
jgi:hypothetical protein